MIDHISIRNFAVIDNVDVDFQEGLSIITGETGSGKSILVTAISLALGSRADSSYVRNGKDKAVVELVATIDDEEIIISREVNAVGKNLCKINGDIVTLSQLAEKCREIADIHGQYDNQSLLNPEFHIDIVDGYRSKETHPIKIAYKEAYDEYLEKRTNLKSLIALEKDNEKKEDYLRFQLKEINDAKIILGEDKTLGERLSVLQNAEKIYASLRDAYGGIEGSGDSKGAYSSMGNTVDNLENIYKYSSSIQEILEESKDIYYRMEDISHSIRALLDQLTYDPGEIDIIIDRINVLDNLKKKYSGGSNTLDDVIIYRDGIEEELRKIENFDDEKEKLQAEYREAKEKLIKAGSNLTQVRKESSADLKTKIIKELKDLNFDEADVDVSFQPLDKPGENGLETIELLVTTNVGEPLKPLAKTSSGGEISRIMLAIKNITADYDGIPTLIFDEIDQGISGKTAAVVGRKLKEIARNHQVICITHLPQIAANCDHSYRIYKESDSSNTYTHVEKLGLEEQIMEIARLLGGEDISEKAIENAKALIGIS